jgi:hypothetical protein
MLDATRLGTAWYNTVTSAGIAPGTPVSGTQLLNIWIGLAQNLIDELQNAEVAPGTFTSPSGAVTGTGGPIS